jgi:hypothetical protein
MFCTSEDILRKNVLENLHEKNKLMNMNEML